MCKIKDLLFAIVMVVLLSGCSGMSSNPSVLQPGVNPKSVDNSSAHMLWGMWDFDVDYTNLTVTPVPLRNLEKHFNITDMVLPPACNNCLTVDVNSFNPGTHLLNLDVSLYNAFGIAGYDVRGIVFTNASGHLLTNADDWTPAYDISGGMEINPFKAYAKSITSRKFAGLAELSENYIISMPSPPQFNLIKFAIDASWPTNAKEPYSIQDFIQLEDIQSDPGSAGIVTVDVLDWQDDIDSVVITAPDLADGWISMVNPSGNTWQAELVNTNGAPEGEYAVEIKAESGTTGITELYGFFNIMITPPPPTLGWARTWGGAGSETCTSIAVDQMGNIIAGGSFSESVDFDPGADIQMGSSNGLGDCYISKFDQMGNLLWAASWGGDSVDTVNCLAVAQTGTIYIGGVFRGLVDFDPGPGVTEVGSSSSYSGFLLALDQYGIFQWVETWGTEGAPALGNVTSVNLGFFGDITVCVNYAGTIDADPGAGESIVASVDDTIDCMVVYLASDGSFTERLIWGGQNNDYINTSYLGFDSALIVGGEFSGSVDFNPDPALVDALSSNAGSIDAFFSKINSEGDLVFVKAFGGPETDTCTTLTSDLTGSIYLGGYFSGTTDFDPTSGVMEYVAVAGQDGYAGKYDSFGNLQWVTVWGGPHYDHCTGIATSFLGGVYITGDFSGTIDFDNSPGNDTHTANGQNDAFIMRLDTSGAYQWTRTWGGGPGEYWDGGSAVATAGIGDVYVDGFFMGPDVDFDLGTGVDAHSSNGQEDVFLMRMTSDGTW